MRHEESVYHPDDRGPVRGNRRLFKGGQKTGGTTTTALPSWMRPYQQDILERASNLSNRAYNPYTGQRFADFNSDQNRLFDMVRQNAGQGPNQSMMAANQSLLDTLNGKFLDANPYFDKVVGRASNRVADAYGRGTAAQNDAAFARAQALGTSGYGEQTWRNEQALGDSLAGLSDSMYSQNYANERQNMMQAAPYMAQLQAQLTGDRERNMAALGMVGDIQQRRQQGLLDLDYNRFLEEQNWPIQNLGLLQDALGAAAMGTGTSTSKMAGGGSGGFQGALGGAASGAALGSQIYPGWGTAIGAIGGGLLGAFS